MVSIARKNLFYNRTRFVITVAGVAFVIGLILFSAGMLLGTIRQATCYVDHTDADVWVTEEGEDFYGFSKIPNSFIEVVSNVEGVQSADTILLHPNNFVRDGQLSEQFELIGYNVASGVGGPWEIREGTTVARDNELVLDYWYAREQGLQVGDAILVRNPNEGGEMSLRIVGLSEGTHSLRADYGFASYATAVHLSPIEGYTGFILLHTDDPQGVTERVNALDGLDAYTRDEIKGSITAYWGKVMGMGMGVTSLLTFIVGMVLVGLTLYTAVLEKTREYGVLKAIGATNRYLYRIIAEQAVIVALSGFLGGVVLSQIFYRLFLLAMPKMELQMHGYLLAGVAVLTVVMCLAASFLAIRQMTKIDPLIVFQS